MLSLNIPLRVFRVSLAMPAFVDGIGRGKVSLIRLRRNRIDLAYSKAVSTAKGMSIGGASDDNGPRDDHTVGPCSAACQWCLCPLDASTHCIPLGRIWGEFTAFQRFLWEIDELECRWMALLNARPGLSYITVDWDQRLTAASVQRIARFVTKQNSKDFVFDDDVADGDAYGGSQGVHGNVRNQHVSDDEVAERNNTQLALEEADYRRAMRIKACGQYHCGLYTVKE